MYVFFYSIVCLNFFIYIGTIHQLLFNFDLAAIWKLLRYVWIGTPNHTPKNTCRYYPKPMCCCLCLWSIERPGVLSLFWVRWCPCLGRGRCRAFSGAYNCLKTWKHAYDMFDHCVHAGLDAGSWKRRPMILQELDCYRFLALALWNVQ
jgi:hypothetical protein